MEDSKSAIAAIIAVLVLVGGGLGIYALTQSDDEETTTATSQVAETEQVADPAPVEEEVAPTETIVELAVATDALSTLVTAVTEADLVTTLSGDGPFTVFAPTNDAFAALPDGTLDSLLADIPALTDVLTYHVVSGKVMAADLSDGQVVPTLQGGELTVKIMNGSVMLEDAAGNMSEVVTADVEASNGVVHVIDGVLLQ
jgi:uncharacterized surface protein with fasciclin (FAS1) repeats